MKRHATLVLSTLMIAGTAWNAALGSTDLPTPLVISDADPLLLDRFSEDPESTSLSATTALDLTQAVLPATYEALVQFAPLSAAAPQTWVTLDPIPENLANQGGPGGLTGSTGSDRNILLPTVPEPGNVAVGALVLGAAAWAVRRRQGRSARA